MDQTTDQVDQPAMAPDNPNEPVVQPAQQDSAPSAPQISPITFPSRIYDEASGSFVSNINRQQSSNSLTTVLTDNNEVVGFKDGTSVDQMQHAIDADRNGSIQEFKGGYYEKNIQPALEALGMDMFQPKFITDIAPTPQRAFATNMASSLLGNTVKFDSQDAETAANPYPALAGQLVGTFGSYATLVGPALESLGLLKATAGLTPFAENIVKNGLSAGVYRAISDSSNQLRDSDHPDLAKVGQGVLHDTLWFGALGGLTGQLSAPVGAAATAGLMYTMAKADGASESDALLNASIGVGAHMMGVFGDHQEVRDLVTSKAQSDIADYIKAKNPLIDDGVSNIAAHELVGNHAEDVINEANQAILDKATPNLEVGVTPAMEGAKPDGQEPIKLTTAQTKTPPPEKPFTDPYDPKMMDYLAQYIPPYRIVRMHGSSRVALANAPVKDLESYAQQHADIAQEDEVNRQAQLDAAADAARGVSRNPIDEVASSQTLSGQLMGKLSKDIGLSSPRTGDSGEPLGSVGEQESSLSGQEQAMSQSPAENKVLENVSDSSSSQSVPSNDDLVKSATGKLKKISQFETSKEYFEKNGSKGSVEKMNQLIEKNKLTPEEENALVAEISGEPQAVPRETAPVSIPEFKSTDEALKFGKENAGNESIQTELTRLYEDSKKKSSALIASDKDEDLQAGMDEAVKGQLFREALEQSQGKIEPIVEEKSEKSAGNESGLSKSVEQSAIEKGLTEDFGDLPSYQTRDMSDIAKKVNDFINKDPDLAKKIALHEAPEQEGLRAQELFTGLRIKAEKEGDVSLLRDLALSDKASAAATELGQRIKALDTGEYGNTTEAIRSVQQAREAAAKKSSKGKDIKTESAKISDDIKKEIKKAAPKKQDWNDFIESIKC